MNEIKELSRFYETIRNDPRIGTSHISLYMALFQLYNLNRFRNPLNIYRKEVMALAKISGLGTFHRCIKDLNQYGYLEYCPSYNPSIQSQVILLNVEIRNTKALKQ
jgi:hypothetical protein